MRGRSAFLMSIDKCGHYQDSFAESGIGDVDQLRVLLILKLVLLDERLDRFSNLRHRQSVALRKAASPEEFGHVAGDNPQLRDHGRLERRRLADV